MTLREYCKQRGRGAVAHLAEASGLAYSTVYKAAFNDRVLKWPTALKL